MPTPLPTVDRAPSPAAGSPPAPSARDVVAPEARDVATAAAPAERRILAVAGETRRTGRWLVPRLLRVRALLGEVRIDLRDSPIPDGFTLDVRALGSRVTLVVPPGVSVAFDVFAALGNAISQAHEPVAEDPRAPVVHVTGSALVGEVRVLVRERAG